MSGNYQRAGFQLIHHDRLWKEEVHDSYKAKGKLPEFSTCPRCGAVFHAGRWQWLDKPSVSESVICPACHRINDHFPAGFLTIHGEFFMQHRDELINLVHNIENREKRDHPLKRIMDIEELEGKMVITTTDINLARNIGEALHHAYKGELEFHYNAEQYLLRVDWSR